MGNAGSGNNQSIYNWTPDTIPHILEVQQHDNIQVHHFTEEEIKLRS
jgi:hypothetical protein